jgi:hypothetical protein
MLSERLLSRLETHRDQWSEEDRRVAAEARSTLRPVAALPVDVLIDISPGSLQCGAHGWLKLISGINLARADGYGLLGEFLPSGFDRFGRPDFVYRTALVAGSYLVAGARGHGSDLVAVFRVARGTDATVRHRRQVIRATNAELLARAPDLDLDVQAVLDDAPELAPVVHGRLLGIFYALKNAGF